jgi:hypothetical protein
MPVVTFNVLQMQGKWVVRRGWTGRSHGPYVDRATAVAAARAFCKMLAPRRCEVKFFAVEGRAPV